MCLFLRWLIRGAEFCVGLLPLGRKRAAPLTVRKLSLILLRWKRRSSSPLPDSDTQGLEVVLGVGDRWTVTSAIPTAAAQTSVTSESERTGYRTLFWADTTVHRAPEVISPEVA